MKQALADEDVGVLGEEAEDQPRHEVVHVVAALGRAPFGVVLQQFDVEPVEAAGGPDVEGVFADLADGADARQRQEEAEVVREVLIGAGDGLAARQVFGLEVDAVGGQDELRLGLGRRRAGLERGQRLASPAPASQVRMWMLLVWSTPPRSDLFDAPARRRLMVVALLPKASRKA